MRGQNHDIRNAIEINSLSAIEHILRHRPDRVLKVFFHGMVGGPRGRVQELFDLARAARIPIDTSPKGPKSGENVRAVVAGFQYADLDQWVESNAEKTKSLVLALDHLQDPQNFGAICRTAEGLGLSGILIPRDRSVAVSSGVYSASVGAVETIPVVQVGNLGEALRRLKNDGYWIIGSSLTAEATTPDKIPDFDKAVLVLGAELEGLSTNVEKACDWITKIPLFGAVQSLNVSAAGAILMYHLSKRLNPTT